ncbi:MAG: ATP synthase F0 subunit B [Bacillota bacterium]
MSYMLMSDLPLGLNFLEILINMFNLAILIIGMRYLLYKPVKKFMDKRRAMYEAEAEASATVKAEAEDMKTTYDGLVKNANEEAFQIKSTATNEAKSEAQEIVATAKAESKLLLLKTAEEAQHNVGVMRAELKNQIADLAVGIAGQILEREVAAADYDALIDSVIADAQPVIEQNAQNYANSEYAIKEEMSAEISEIAVLMASKILERETNVADNDVAIESILGEWKKR